MSTTLSNEIYKISQHGEPYLYSISRDTFEKNKTSQTFGTIFKDKLTQKDTFYIIIGTDGGLLVDYILEQGIPYGSRYIFIDHQNILDTIKSQLTFTKWDDNVALCNIDEWQQVAEKFRVQGYLFTEKVELVKSIAAIDAFDSRYFELDENLNLTLTSLRHKTMRSLSRRPFIVRQLENLSENSRPFIELKDRFSGKECIVLGGGPSLDTHIEWVKKHRNNYIIIAVSRIARKLIADNLTPDFIFSVDPHDVSFDVSKEMLDLPEHVIFVHSNYVVPKLLGQWKGQHFYCGQRTPWSGNFSIDNIELQGPTVTNSAVFGAMHLGFKRVLLCGFDLCYAKNGATHSSNSNEAKVGPILNQIGQWVNTYEGQLAETSTSFLHASYVLAEQAKVASENGCEFINLSSTAAAIEGIKQVAPSQITKPEQSDELQGILNSISQSHSDITAQNKTLLKEIDKLLKDISSVEKIVKQALKDNQALYKTYSDEVKNHNIKLKLDKAEKKLNDKYEKTSLFLKKFGIKSFIKVVRTDGDQDWSNEDMEETGKLYYQAYVDTIDDIRPLLFEAKSRINNRIAEVENPGKFDALVEQWKKDEQYERINIWLNQIKNRGLNIDSKQQQIINELITKHRSVMEDEDTFHLKRTQKSASLAGLNRKILYLFQRRNENGLAQLKQNLIKLIKDKPENKWLLELCSAYEALLNKNTQIAYNHFMQIDERLFTEDEAIQVSSLALSLGEISTAESYMKKLADLSDTHKPRYAKLLKIENKIDEAEQTYLSYLQSNSADIHVMYDLVTMYLEQQKYDLAKQVLHQILDIDPDNADVKKVLDDLS